MKYSFPYKEFQQIKLPDERISGVYSISTPSVQENVKQLIKNALNNPIGSSRIRDCVRPGTKVLIVLDDNTRTTRTELILPAVIEELESAGLGTNDITMFVALGTHRVMTQQEMEQKYSPEIVNRYRFVSPNWKNHSEYAVISASSDFEIRIHTELFKAEFIIGIGQTTPHLIAGFGGGCKIVNPGCADPDTIGRMHWFCSMVNPGKLFAVRDNPVRKLIDEVGINAGLKFIINEVPGRDDSVANIFAGDPVIAHRKACEFAYDCCSVKIAELTDIVISDAYPSDIDLWQALKGLNAACGAVRPGGTVILVTPCWEGVCVQHPEIASIGFKKSPKYIESLVNSGQLNPIPAAALWLGSQLTQRATVILVTTGISRKEIEDMGLLYASEPESALNYALSRHGPAAKINVLYKASKIICKI